MRVDGARVTALRSETAARLAGAHQAEVPFWTDMLAAIEDLQKVRSRLDPLAAAELDIGRRFDIESG